jgi:hypothetical protein
MSKSTWKLSELEIRTILDALKLTVINRVDNPEIVKKLIERFKSSLNN